MNKKSVTGAEGQNGLFASAVYDKDKNELIVKVANTDVYKRQQLAGVLQTCLTLAENFI